MKIRDLQFVNRLLGPEYDQVLDMDIQIENLGENDTIATKGNTLVYRKPSSIGQFLFHILQYLGAKHSDGMDRDKLSLALYGAVVEYVHANNNEHKHPGPPVVIDFDKLSVPSFIIRELVEPLIGKVKASEVFFIPCNHIDTCTIVKDSHQLQNGFSASFEEATFPLVVCNCDINNSAAQLCHITVKILENALGYEESQSVISKILLGQLGSVSSNLILILKVLKGDPAFIVEFLDLLDSHVELPYNREEALDSQYKEIQGDSYLREHIVKTAAPSPQVWRQWSQWSMLMGLIEKQLGPMRGSMWPATELVKPHEDKFRLMLKQRNKEKGKNQANFEEMLEAARDLYDHNAIEPGKLIEVLLKDNRVWKQ